MKSTHLTLCRTIVVLGGVFCPFLLPAHAGEQGNVIGSVSIYICVCTKKNCN